MNGNAIGTKWSTSKNQSNFPFKFSWLFFVFFFSLYLIVAIQNTTVELKSLTLHSNATKQARYAGCYGQKALLPFFLKPSMSTLWQADYSALWHILTTQTGSNQNGPNQVSRTIPVSKSTTKQQRQWKLRSKPQRIQSCHFTNVVVDPVPIRDSEFDQGIVQALLYFLILTECQRSSGLPLHATESIKQPQPKPGVKCVNSTRKWTS